MQEVEKLQRKGYGLMSILDLTLTPESHRIFYEKISTFATVVAIITKNFKGKWFLHVLYGAFALLFGTTCLAVA
jgi:uncharacterized membrane protein HdeD (DUF308 family)